MKAAAVDREELDCESAILCVPGHVQLDPQVLLDAFAATFRAAGDELSRVTIRRPNGSKATSGIEEARASLRVDAAFTNLQAIPKSERGRAAARWLSTGLVFAESKFSKTIYFGRLRAESESFSPHIVLWRELVTRVEPSYGFMYYRRYGLGPAYFAVGIALNAGMYGSTQYDDNLVTTWAAETQGDPRLNPRSYRHERGMFLDVFPVNLLSPKHLEQRVFDKTLGEWIQSLGPGSKVEEVARGFVIWGVSAALRMTARKELEKANLLIPVHGSGPRLN